MTETKGESVALIKAGFKMKCCASSKSKSSCLSSELKPWESEAQSEATHSAGEGQGDRFLCQHHALSEEGLRAEC